MIYSGKNIKTFVIACQTATARYQNVIVEPAENINKRFCHATLLSFCPTAKLANRIQRSRMSVVYIYMTCAIHI